MRTKYLGIESIVLCDYMNVTIACNLIIQGNHYDEPIYSHIFCDYKELMRLLDLPNSAFARSIQKAISDKLICNGHSTAQVDLPDYLTNEKRDWEFPSSVDLVETVEEHIPIPCYQFSPEFFEHEPSAL